MIAALAKKTVTAIAPAMCVNNKSVGSGLSQVAECLSVAPPGDEARNAVVALLELVAADRVLEEVGEVGEEVQPGVHGVGHGPRHRSVSGATTAHRQPVDASGRHFRRPDRTAAVVRRRDDAGGAP